MRITDLQVDGFGVWQGLTLEQFSNELTVFYGQNEAGKSTLLQFFRAVMYGFEPARRARYLPPVHGDTGGGSLYLETDQGDFQIQRLITDAKKSSSAGDLAVTAADGAIFGSDKLKRLLGDIDERVYANVFAIGLREIQELATLNDTDAAQLLYRLSSGLDRVSLVDVMRSLKTERRFIAGEHGQAGKLKSLQSELRDAQRQLEQTRLANRRWSKLGAEIAELARESEEVASQLAGKELDRRKTEVAMQIAPRWMERSGLEARIDDLGDLPDPQTVSTEKLDRLVNKAHQIQARIDEYDRRMQEVRSEAESLPVDKAVLEAGCRIEAVVEHVPWLESLEKQVERLRNERNTLRKETGVGDQSNDSPPAPVESIVDVEVAGDFDGHISAKTLTLLKGPARALKRAQRRRESRQKSSEEIALRLATVQEELDSRLMEYECDDLDESLEAAAAQVNVLKRRIQLEDRLVQLGQQHAQMESEIQRGVDTQLMPPGRMIAVGGCVVFGVALFIFGFAGWFFESVSANPTLGITGIVVAAVGVIIKLAGDASARGRLERAQKQRELIDSQIQNAEDDCRELDEMIGANGHNLHDLLSDSESALARLEDLIPLRQQWDDCRRELDEAEAGIQEADGHLESMNKRWMAALRSAGLPTGLSPSQVKAIAGQSEKAREQRARLRQCETEIEERQAEIDRLADRVHRIADEIGWDRATDDPKEQVEALHRALMQQRQLRQRRIELRTQYRDYRRQGKKLRRNLNRVGSFRQRMLERSGAKDDREYRDFAIRLQQREEMLAQIEVLDEQMEAALGAQFDRDEIAELIDEIGKEGLESQWEAIQSDCDDLQQRRAEIHVWQGERRQERKALGQDRTQDELLARIAQLEKKIERVRRRWDTLSMATGLLDSLRKRYEAERQPETLQEASCYLSQITGGKYTRLWTRLEGDELWVDGQNDLRLSVDQLSQGTREAIFLSLRLALVSLYGRRGIAFPLVLDDVLVNYDAVRTRAAAELLCEYAAQGHQVILFTCHDHIRDLFARLQADVRVLPDYRDVIAGDATAEPYELRSTITLESMVVAEPEPEHEVDEVIEESTDDERFEEREEEEVEELAADEPVAEEPQEDFEDTELETTYESVANDDPTDLDEDVIDYEPRPVEIKVPAPQTTRQRFTWGSPEMWWEDDDAA